MILFLRSSDGSWKQFKQQSKSITSPNEDDLEKGKETRVFHSLKIVTIVEVFQKLWSSLVFGAQVLYKSIAPNHVLSNDVMPLLCMFDNVVEFLCRFEEKHVDYLVQENKFNHYLYS